MAAHEIARPYAQTLIELSREASDIDDYYSAFESIIDIYQSNLDFQKLLSAPFLRIAEKHQLLTDLFQGRIPDLFLNFLRVVIDHRREFALYEIFQIFEELYLQEKNIKRAIVTSAVALSKEDEESIQKTLKEKTGHDVKIFTKVDSRVVAGLVVQIGEQYIDLSLGKKIREIRNQMLKTTLEK